MTDTPGGSVIPVEDVPPIPLKDTPRDMDGVLVRGSVLALGNQPYIANGDFFVAPIGKVRRGGTRGGTTYKWTPEGWASAWAQFEAGDPAAAVEYRRLDATRQEDLRRDTERRAQAEAPMIALRSMWDASFAVVPKCGWITGYGFSGFAEYETFLFFLPDRIEVVAADSAGPALSLGLDEVVVIQVDGPGRVTTGGGFIGGGVGLMGALEGIGIARMLNALTTRSTVQTFIEIHAFGRHAVWVTDQVTPQELNLLLRPVQARLRDVHMFREQPAVDPLDRLAKLGALRDSGVLNNDEYLLAKATILRDLR